MFYYVEPGDNAALEKAFKKCGELMNLGGHVQTAIVIPQLSNLQGMIRDYLGDEAVSALAKNKVIKLNPESILLFTKRQPPRLFKGPILAAFTPTEQLKSVISACPGADIVFVPWTFEERDVFVDQFSPFLI